jgi:hypothetical protein
MTQNPTIGDKTIANEIRRFEASSREEAERIAVMIENSPVSRVSTSKRKRQTAPAQNADALVFGKVVVDHEARIKQLIIAEWFTRHYRLCEENFEAHENAKAEARQLELLSKRGVGVTVTGGPVIRLRIEREIYARNGDGTRVRGSKFVPEPPKRRASSVPDDVLELFYQEKMAGMRKLLRVPQDLLHAPRQAQHASPHVHSAVRKKRSDLLEELNESITSCGLRAVSKKDWLWTVWFLREFLCLPENAHGGDSGKPVWVVPTSAGVLANNNALMRMLASYVEGYSQIKGMED